MMSRGISSPSWVRRNPVSIGCAASVLISMISPRFACAATLTMAFAILDQAFLETGRERHRVAVVDQGRQLELDPAAAHRGIAYDPAQRNLHRRLAQGLLVGIDLRLGRRRRGDGSGATGENQEFAAGRHLSVNR